MLSQPTRIALIVASVAYGVVKLLAGLVVGWLFVAAGAIFLFGLFRYGPVQLAFRAGVGGDLSRAEALVQQVRRPEWLTTESRAYFHWVKGLVASSKGRKQEAYEHFGLAARGGLRSDHIRAATEVALAETALDLGDSARAATHLDRARAIPHRRDLDASIEVLQQKAWSA